MAPDSKSATAAGRSPGDGGMHAHVYAYDWAQTPLGALENWPHCLKMAVTTCLDAGFAHYVWWGSELTQVYNDAAVDILRAKHPAALGQPARECWADIWSDVGPLVDKVLATGAAERRERYALVPDRGGAREPAYFDFCYSALRDETGNVAGVFVTTVETTEQVRTEAALRESETRLAADLAGMRRLYDLHARLSNETRLYVALGEIIDAANDFLGADRGCVQLVSDDGQRLEMVAYRGYEPSAEFIQHFLHDGSPPACDAARRERRRLIIEDVETFPDLIGTRDREVALASGIRATQSTPLISHDGEMVGVLSTQFPHPHRPRDDELRLIDLLAWTAADFVKRHRITVELADTSRAKDEFLAMLGHELRNPLQPIMTSLQLMRLRQPLALVNERGVIESQVRHLIDMVDDLLDVSRIARGKVELKKAPVYIGDIVARALETTRPLLEEHEQTIETKIADHLMVNCDARRLVQVVTNLLTNAAKYSPSRGTIAISTRAEGNDVVIRVRDQGIGIDPSLLPNIFEAFTQDAQSLERSQGGLGLGLSIVHNLVQMHGGSVTATSEGRGHGSEFTVRLPLFHSDREPSPVGVNAPRLELSTAQAVRTSEREKLKVLIVDDYVGAAESLAALLDAEGFKTCIAHDGPAALASAAEFRPAVALIDIGLPVMDGYEVARRLRSMPELAGLRLVAITGYGQASDQQRTREAGFDRHIVKPIDPAGIGELVRQTAAAGS